MWLNQIDKSAHTIAEYHHDEDLVGTTVSGDYTAYYHENRLYSVRKKGSSVTALVYAGNPYKAIERVRAAGGQHGRCGLDAIEICGGHCQDLDDEQEDDDENIC